MKLLGLYREAGSSPGRHRSNDALLLEQVAETLRSYGCSVELMTLDAASASRPRTRLVFSMCQGGQALELLMNWERAGARLINSPMAARNTHRDRLPTLMRASGIPYPSTMLVTTHNGAASNVALDGGVWLKRGDVHASVSSDVQWVDTHESLLAGLREFAVRGIGHAAVQQHRAGDEIKFYGIAGGSFFHWFYPGERAGHPVDEAKLQQLAAAAAAAAGLDIFGGDVIVASDGELTLIDLNDWPSFAPCRDRASEAIAHYLMRRMDAFWNPGLVSSANESAV